jgi:integrative and conjugative element protein (TIGR02256 family)
MRRGRRSQNWSVRVLDSALGEARTFAETALPGETGGILLGYRSERGVEVQGFLEVPDEQAGPTRYRRRHAAAQARLEAAIAGELPGSPIGYVGEWHSHPEKEGPSSRDVHELRECARQVKDHIALVVLFLDRRSWTAAAWAGKGRRCHAVAAIEIVHDGPEEGE